MNDLQKYFYNNTGNMIHKWEHFFEIYDSYFSKYRNTNVIFLEIGVYQGGSLQMWKEYFGPKAKIYGIDINPACKKFEDEQIEIIIGDQEDKDFLESLKSRIPKIDILLDDGGHTMKQQINTFEVLFEHIKDGGVFMCEDTHTSYWREYGGGFKKKNTFIEYSKNIIDDINAWHSKSRKLNINSLTKNVKAIHFYDSIIVLEKRKILHPTVKKTGLATINDVKNPKANIFRRYKSIGNKLLDIIF